jgi:hypothetical protein
VLTDPGYKDKVARLDRLRDRCQHADVPRWIGTTLMLGGLVTTLVGAGKKDPIIASVGGNMFAGGVGSYFIGYYKYGGAECNRARLLYDEVDVEVGLRQLEVMGTDRAAEMKILAKEFNDRHRIQGASNTVISSEATDGDATDSAGALPTVPPPDKATSDEAPPPEASARPMPESQ